MVLYADVLFLVDLSMDFLTLHLCVRLTHRKVHPLRLLIGSVTGAIGSVWLVCFGAGRGMTFFSGLLLSALMTGIVFGFGRTAGAFLRQYLLVWGSGAITGGCMSLLLSLGTPVYLSDGSSSGSTQPFLPLFLATTGMVYSLIRILQKRLHIQTADVQITCHGQTARCTVLVDSGNLLTDPLTGRAVVLVSQNAVAALPLPTDKTVPGLIPIPANGVQGTRLLWGFRPEALYINGVARDACIATEPVPVDHYGGYSGTCPISLV